MSKISNILQCNCPHCGKVSMYKTSVFNFLSFAKMNEKCTSCETNFHPEPGYYLGAMYVSYFISSFVFLITALVSMVVFEFTLTKTFVLLGVLAVLILPYTLRVSRTIWLAIDN
jgi:uncharacterized protein (DUF983 family)